LQIRIIVLCGLVALLDGFDLLAIGVAAPAMAGSLHIAPNQLGAVFSAALVASAVTLGAVGHASQSTTLVIVFLGLAGFFLGVASSGVIALAPSLYSTAIRSTGVGWAMGLGRLGSFVGPLAVGLLVNRGWPVGDSFVAIGAPALGAALFTSLIGMNRQEKPSRVPLAFG
jgi:AAHS family 4-hydroxybenzoate transporter-like MFS transporter